MQRQDLLLPVAVISFGLCAWSLGISLPSDPCLLIAGVVFAQVILVYYSETIVRYTNIIDLIVASTTDVVVKQRIFNAIVNLGRILIITGKLCFQNGRWTGPRTSGEGVTMSIMAVIQCVSLLVS